MRRNKTRENRERTKSIPLKNLPPLRPPFPLVGLDLPAQHQRELAPLLHDGHACGGLEVEEDPAAVDGVEDEGVVVPVVVEQQGGDALDDLVLKGGRIRVRLYEIRFNETD